MFLKPVLVSRPLPAATAHPLSSAEAARPVSRNQNVLTASGNRVPPSVGHPVVHFPGWYHPPA